MSRPQHDPNATGWVSQFRARAAAFTDSQLDAAIASTAIRPTKREQLIELEARAACVQEGFHIMRSQDLPNVLGPINKPKVPKKPRKRRGALYWVLITLALVYLINVGVFVAFKLTHPDKPAPRRVITAVSSGQVLS